MPSFFHKKRYAVRPAHEFPLEDAKIESFTVGKDGDHQALQNFLSRHGFNTQVQAPERSSPKNDDEDFPDLQSFLSDSSTDKQEIQPRKAGTIVGQRKNSTSPASTVVQAMILTPNGSCHIVDVPLINVSQEHRNDPRQGPFDLGLSLIPDVREYWWNQSEAWSKRQIIQAPEPSDGSSSRNFILMFTHQAEREPHVLQPNWDAYKYPDSPLEPPVYQNILVFQTSDIVRSGETGAAPQGSFPRIGFPNFPEELLVDTHFKRACIQQARTEFSHRHTRLESPWEAPGPQFWRPLPSKKGRLTPLHLW